MRTSSKFIFSGVVIAVAYLLDLLFFQAGLEILRIVGYVVFGLILLWIVHGITTEKKDKKLQRAEEFVTHPFLMLCLLIAGVAFIALAFYNFFISNVLLVTFAFMLEIGILFILLAYNNMKEGRKRGHW